MEAGYLNKYFSGVVVKRQMVLCLLLLQERQHYRKSVILAV